ncbi:hypothetical protein RFI_27838 [Reticulomyxa filosa]|uniref:Extradiol ring-cleavage dioxygenase class III enzyme subunit B domain-containing protein n=1 Tax=Reticulomyxa filosa TaxID=46433 RepID=X6M6B8_RETFI|nr:hypothetical protein RFI_27838 [Reticulomyxa filosa]|eukprot:ETO09538.1 hypothetical protein RFI_27838 [Reticulomyxa filosa]
MYLILLVFCSFYLKNGVSKITAAAILPHGDFAYDPSLVNYENGSAQLHNASLLVGEWIDNIIQPDLIFLSTPHGMELTRDFLIYSNTNDSGYAVIGDNTIFLNKNNLPSTQSDISNFRQLKTNVDAANGLIQHLLDANSNNNITGMIGFADSIPLFISWGELIPTSFLNGLSNSTREYIIFSQPLRRYNNSVQMIPELLSVGGQIFSFFETNSLVKDLNVLVLISADLAHTHLSNGPYGYCTCAEPYDMFISKWVQSMNRTYLLTGAAQEQSLGAMSCGFTGFVLLQGMFDESIKTNTTNQIHEKLLDYKFFFFFFSQIGSNFKEKKVSDWKEHKKKIGKHNK